jgi:hypothetical protein
VTGNFDARTGDEPGAKSLSSPERGLASYNAVAPHRDTLYGILARCAAEGPEAIALLAP